MERDGAGCPKIMEFQGATRDFMRNPAVAEKVKVKFIIKALEKYFPRMAQTLQNERESLESLNQRPDHTWVFRRLQELKLKTQEGGWFRALENSARRDSIMSISGDNKSSGDSQPTIGKRRELDRRRCRHCDKLGHSEKNCWQAHPERRRARLPRAPADKI